jgi:hypothetical protein
VGLHIPYDAAADHFDDEPLSFWERIGRRTVTGLGLPAGDNVLDVGILDWRSFRPDFTDGENVGTQRGNLLLDGIAGVEMAYCGSVDAERLPPKWTSEWIANLGLPQLIRVRVTFPPGESPPVARSHRGATALRGALLTELVARII